MTTVFQTKRQRLLIGGLALLALVFAFGCGGGDGKGMLSEPDGLGVPKGFFILALPRSIVAVSRGAGSVAVLPGGPGGPGGGDAGAGGVTGRSLVS